MQVRYYKVGLMAYATRQRYLDISKFEYYKEEDNRSVRLGNGVNTFVKTTIDDINEPREISYVTIDDTRWFVTDYIYLNGKQVQLNLQRDVVGEFGLSNAYGKVERGYTDGVLKYRKELSLNEVLKNRYPLKSSTSKYGNLEVDNHDGEMWGVLYFTKDSKEDKISINIPAFEPAYEIGTPPQINKQYKNGSVSQSITFVGDMYVGTSRGNMGIRFTYRVSYSSATEFTSSISYVKNNLTYDNQFDAFIRIYGTPVGWFDDWVDRDVQTVKTFLDQNLSSNGFTRPSASGVINLDAAPQNANGNIYKEADEYYQYTIHSDTKTQYGTINFSTFKTAFEKYYNSLNSQWRATVNLDGYHTASSQISVPIVSYTRTQLSHSDAGILDIPMSQQLVDEPYCVLVFPLYSANLKIDGKTYPIAKADAFTIFNEVILSLSGDNPFLVDAQIYPYCPRIDKVQCSLKSGDSKEYPFMSVLSTFFETPIKLNPRPYFDVKKEYITRNYSIVSPDQSSKFTFNFYDYVNAFVKDGDYNNVELNITIKTALKPFAIISSAVIERVNSLKGLNYASNLEGSQPSSNGFECSLASDAFETYKRQNSNYQQIFELDRGELMKVQEVERVNEATQFAMNMLTGTTFGAIAGAQMGDAGVWGSLVGSKGIGAGVGAGVAAGAIGAAGGLQLAKNDELRAYELELQKQRYDLTLGTIKNLPNSVNRISSFNEIIMQDFYYVFEVYECTDDELQIVDDFIDNYGYGIGVFDFLQNYSKSGWFLKASVTKSDLPITLHQVLKYDIEGGVYIND